MKRREAPLPLPRLSYACRRIFFATLKPCSNFYGAPTALQRRFVYIALLLP